MKSIRRPQFANDITPDLIGAMADNLQKVTNLSGSGCNVSEGPGGLSIQVPPPPPQGFFAKIGDPTESGTYHQDLTNTAWYQWYAVELRTDTDDTSGNKTKWVKTGGQSSSTIENPSDHSKKIIVDRAREINDLPEVPVGAVVWLTIGGNYANGTEYTFAYGQVEPFELYDDIAPGGIDKYAWLLKLDALTRDETKDKIKVSDGILGDVRARGSQSTTGTGARGWFMRGPDGKNQILSIQRQAVRLNVKTTGAVDSADTDFTVDHVIPIDGGQNPVNNETSEVLSGVSNWMDWQCAAATEITIEADGDGGWQIAEVPLVMLTVVTAVDYDSSTGQLRKKTRSINCWATGAESSWTPYTTALAAGSDEQRDATTTAISLDSSSVTYGTAITITATVSHSAGIGDPTGEFAFFDTLPIGTPQGVGSTGTGEAKLIVSLPVGSHSLTAIYGGDASYNGSTSSASSATVTKMDTTTTCSTSSGTTTYGGSVTLTADVATTNENPDCLAPSGKVEFFYKIGSGSYVSLGLVRVTGTVGSSGHGASATCYLTLATLPAGSLTIKATYAGDDNYNTSNGTHSQTVNKASLVGTIVDVTRDYGAANPSFTFTWAGFKFADTPSVITGTASFTTSATTTSNVGSYNVSATIGTMAADNYDISFVIGHVIVAAVPLSITAANKSMAHGDSLPAFTGSVSGIVNGDDITFSGSTTASSSSPAGTYAIVAGYHDPDSKIGNYTLTTTNGTLTIT
jgi:hypothetical protein